MFSYQLLSALLLSSAVLALPAPATTTSGKAVTVPISRIGKNPFLNSRFSQHWANENGPTSDKLYDLGDFRYIANLTVGSQDLQFMLDSGSSDTYFYLPEALANYSQPTPPTFNISQAGRSYISTGVRWVTFYGKGDRTEGNIAFINTTLTGTDLKVPYQAVVAVDIEEAPGGTSGLVGLGWPLGSRLLQNLANTYSNVTLAPVPRRTFQQWLPIVPRLFNQSSIPRNLYTLTFDGLGAAANQNIPLPVNGSLTLGGFPDNLSDSDFTWSPVPVVNLTKVAPHADLLGYPALSGNRWTTKLEAVYLNGQYVNRTQLLLPNVTADPDTDYVLVDSGNPTMTVPKDVLEALSQGAYLSNPTNKTIPCNTQYDFQMQFSGKNFTINPADLFISARQAGIDSPDCVLRMRPFTPSGDEYGPGTSQSWQLGDVFMRSLITVFDYGDLYDAGNNPPRMGFRASAFATS